MTNARRAVDEMSVSCKTIPDMVAWVSAERSFEELMVVLRSIHEAQNWAVNNRKNVIGALEKLVPLLNAVKRNMFRNYSDIAIQLF